MSTDAQGKTTCDICGVQLFGNIMDSLILNYLNVEADQIDTLHFCLDREDVITDNGDETTQEVEGCQRQVLTEQLKSVLRNSTQEESS